MKNQHTAVAAIVQAIRDLTDASKTPLNHEHPFSIHPDLHQVLDTILYSDVLGEVDWSTVSDDLNSDNWYRSESLGGKSTNDLRAIMYQHFRNERFSRGHIQSLAAAGYFDQWADALEASNHPG